MSSIIESSDPNHNAGAKPVLECRHLHKVYDQGPQEVVVLTDVNLGVSPGEQIAVVGSSGSGKTTLLNLLGGHPEPAISYRQHGGNAIGSNDGWSARTQRLRSLIRGVFRTWNNANLAALEANNDMLSDEARAVLESFRQARTGPLPRRLRHLAQSGIFRQTPIGQLGLYLACALGRL